MTRDDALKYIPPGFVECSVYTYNASDDSMRFNFINDGIRGCIYAIPAPKPEPRLVPCGEMVVVFNEDGFCHGQPDPVNLIRQKHGNSLTAVANTKWKFNFDAREWVEVLDES